MIDRDGWLEGVRREPSPNADERPVDSPIDLIVLHGISLPPGCFGGGFIHDLFCNRLDPRAHPSFPEVAPLRVSAHVLVERGGTLTQYVSFHRRAWHAGLSEFEGRARCNDFSIGIELEGCDDQAYADVQYGALIRLCRALMGRWPGITPGRVVGHCDVAPGRKTDPGPAFDWARVVAGLAR